MEQFFKPTLVEQPQAIQYDPERVIRVMLANHELLARNDQRQHVPVPDQLSVKITLDGRPCGGQGWLQESLVGLNINPKDVQSPDGVYPVVVARCEESCATIKSLTTPLCEHMRHSQANGIVWQGL